MFLKMDKVERLKLRIEKGEADVAQATYHLNAAKAELKLSKAALKTAEAEAKKAK